MNLNWKTLILGIVGALCYLLIYSRPMWNFKFIAPQYPDGLEIQIFMTGAQGDVFEIDIINHYIGMQKLELAAVNEKAMAPYVLLFLSCLSILIGLFPKKKLSRFLALPIIGFPLAFTGIFYLWLYKFGHDLNPAAPVRLTPFTPTILGEGIIGQFQTFATPSLGFYLACLPGILAIINFYLVRKSNQT